jgi:hypothetical protein
MRYEKEIGRHLAGVIKTLIEAEANEARSDRTKAMKEHKEITNPSAYAVIQEAKRFHAMPKAEKKCCY